MIMMLVSETQDKSKDLVRFLKEETINMVHYSSPMKALDNLQEIKPDALVIDAVDFPRHWKVLTQYLRYEVSKNDVVVILIVNSQFSALEVDKALKVGVQGVINVEQPYDVVLNTAKDIFTKYKCITSRHGAIGTSFESKACSFLFVEPTKMSIVTGKIKDIQSFSILFIPDMKVEGIYAGDILINCSLKLGDKILTPKCRVVKIESYLNLEFIDLSDDDASILNSFLNKESEEGKKAV